MTSTDISPARILRATRTIDPVFRDSPQLVDDALNRACDREIHLKVETMNPIRSFKGRGADFLLADSAETRSVVCASAGNFGQAVAYAGHLRGLDVTVFVAAGASSVKIARMRGLGADVVTHGDTLAEAKRAARKHADADTSRVFVEDGRDPRIAEGAGTIGVELSVVEPDLVTVPLGDGALAAGMAAWLRAALPDTRVVGVCAAGAPAMAHSWHAGAAVRTSTVATMADGIAITEPIDASVRRLTDLVDDVVLVDEDAIMRALRSLRDTVGLVVEPSAAVGVAALAEHDIPGHRAATVLTGSNFSAELLDQLGATAPPGQDRTAAGS